MSLKIFKLPSISFTKNHIRVASLVGNRVRIGPSEFAASKLIGDITKITFPVTGNINAANIHWEGYQQSEGDELYHTVWGNIEGVFQLCLPFGSNNVKINEACILSPESLCFDEAKNCDWVLEMDVDETSLNYLMSPDQYSKFIRNDELSNGEGRAFTS